MGRMIRADDGFLYFYSFFAECFFNLLTFFITEKFLKANDSICGCATIKPSDNVMID